MTWLILEQVCEARARLARIYSIYYCGFVILLLQDPLTFLNLGINEWESSIYV